MGNEAWKMIGRTPGYIVAVRPLREGAITDFDITERMIRLLLRRAGVTKLNRPRVLICVPSAITSVERRAVKEAARRAGASAAHLIEQPMAAAIGAGLDIHEPVGQHGGRRRGRHDRDGGDLPGRGRGLAGDSVRRLRHGRRHPALRAPRARHRHRRAHRRGDQAGHRLGPALRRRGQGRGAGPGDQDRTAQDGDPLARGGALRHPGSGRPDRGHRGGMPGRVAARAGPGHHLRGHPPGRRGSACCGAWPIAWPRRPRCRSTWWRRRWSAWCWVPGICLESFDSLRPIFAAAET